MGEVTVALLVADEDKTSSRGISRDGSLPFVLVASRAVVDALTSVT